MRIVFSAAIILGATAISAPVSAATDPGLSVPGALYQKQNSGGVGAQMGVRIKLGQDRVTDEAERVELGISVGPLLSGPDARVLGGTRHSIAPLAKFSLKPGYSAQVTALGVPIAKHYTLLGAAQADEAAGEDEKKNKRRKTRKVIGYSALGALGAVVLTGVGLGIALATQGPTD